MACPGRLLATKVVLLEAIARLIACCLLAEEKRPGGLPDEAQKITRRLIRQAILEVGK